ncbi:Phosphonate ABC transporter, inner membrane subunit, partial [Candidatus Arthromitus sp. SFB-5]
MSEMVLRQYEKEPRNFIWKIITALICVFLIVWSSSTVSLEGISQNGLQIAKNIFLGIFAPDTELLFDFVGGVPYLLLETMCIAFLGTLVGSVLA